MNEFDGIDLSQFDAEVLRVRIDMGNGRNMTLSREGLIEARRGLSGLSERDIHERATAIAAKMGWSPDDPRARKEAENAHRLLVALYRLALEQVARGDA